MRTKLLKHILLATSMARRDLSEQLTHCYLWNVKKYGVELEIESFSIININHALAFQIIEGKRESLARSRWRAGYEFKKSTS